MSPTQKRILGVMPQFAPAVGFASGGVSFTPRARKAKSMPQRSEHDEQKALITWANLHTTQQPDLLSLFAIPNGGQRSKATAGKLKAEGVKSGVPDLCLPAPRGKFHGLFIEMKRAHEGTTSATQDEWGQRLTRSGYAWHVCHGADAAIAALRQYLSLPAFRSAQPPAKRRTPRPRI